MYDTNLLNQHKNSETEEWGKTVAENMIIYLCRFKIKNDDSLTILKQTGACKKITGYLQDELKNGFYKNILPADHIHIPAYTSLTVGETKTLQYRIMKRNGNIRWIEEKRRGIEGTDNIKVFDSVFSDITEKRSLENQVKLYKSFLSDITDLRINQMSLEKEAAKHRQKITSDFLSNMTHEFKTPLHHVISFCDLAQKNAHNGNNQKLQNLLNEIKMSAENLNLFVNDLLDMAEINTKTLTIHYEETNIIELIKALKEEYHPLFAMKSLNFNFFYKLPQPVWKIDKDKIYVSIKNLLKNAVKFSPANGTIDFFCGHIRIKTEKTGIQKKYLLFSISNEGEKIPENELTAVFEKFKTGSGNTDGSGGRGLGLAIAKAVVEEHRGRIWAENNNGPGVSFKFLLPAKENSEKDENIKVPEKTKKDGL